MQPLRGPVGLFLLLVVLPCFAQNGDPLGLSGVPEGYQDAFSQQLTRLQLPCSVSQARLRAVMNRNDDELRDLTRAAGYYSASWDIGSQVTDNGCQQVLIALVPGPRARYESVDIQLLGEGSNQPDLTRLLADSPLRAGAAVDHAQYEQFKSDLTRLAGRLGFFDAGFEVSQLRVDPAANSAVAILHYQTGPRYRYGELQAEQNSISPQLLQRFSPIVPDAPYSSEDIQQFQQDLLNSRYFSSLVVRPLIDERREGVVDVRLQAQPNDRWRYEAGVGIATDTGPSFSLGVDNRRVTAEGQRASLRTSISDTVKTGELSYAIPLANPVSDRLQWQIGFREEDTSSATGRQVSLGVSRVTLRDSGWVRTTALDYSIEDTDISTQDFTSQLLIPSVGWQRSAKSSGRRTMQGWRMSFDLLGSSSVLASDFDFTQARVDAKYIMPLGGGRLLARGGLGATWVEQVDLLPASLRFFAGGDNSIRGYNFDEVGPTDALGQVVGGRHLAVGSLEFAWPIRQNWDIAAFADGGNAFDDNQFTWKQGAGIGLRWHSLIGTLRFDLAVNDEGDTRFHLFIGPEL